MLRINCNFNYKGSLKTKYKSCVNRKLKDILKSEFKGRLQMRIHSFFKKHKPIGSHMQFPKRSLKGILNSIIKGTLTI